MRRFALLLVVICLQGLWTVRVMAQGVAFADIPETTSSQLEKEANLLLNNNQFAEAVPYLEELATRMAAARTGSGVVKYDKVLFSLGIGLLQAEEFEDAGEVFKKYVRRFPKSDRHKYAMDYMGDCYRILGRYDAAAKAYAALRKKHRLGHSRDMEVLSKQADCYILPGKWDEALPLLEELMTHSRKSSVRGKAAKGMIHAYISMDKANRIFDVLPALLAVPHARHDPQFNLVLIQGGDKLYYHKKYLQALVLYKLAMPKEVLLQWLTEQIEQEETKRDENIKSHDFRQAIATKERIFELRNKIKDIQNTDNYSEQLRFRIAQTYYEMGRKWEALWVYWSIWEEYSGGEASHDALFAAFSLAAELTQFERALEWGQLYMSEFEKGDYFDDVSLRMAQIHIHLAEFDEAIALAMAALKISPEHTYVDRLVFIMGYCQFQREKFDDALRAFQELKTTFPDSDTRESADYWLALTYLFNQEFQVALDDFSEFAERYIGGLYYEDARFRIGVALYGLQDFDAARGSFTKFVWEFPDNPLRAEAHMFLGDIAGAQGDLEKAIEEYKEVPLHTDRMSQINYAVFQVGKIMELQGDFAGVADYFRKYIDNYGLRGNYTEALWRIGFAKEQMGDIEGVHRLYESAIKRFGNKPAAIGIDLIMETYPVSYIRYNGEEPRSVMRKMLKDARRNKQWTLALRLRRALALLPSAEGRAAPTFTAEDIKVASPAVLIWIGQTCTADQPAMARTVFDRVLSLYSETEWSEEALLGLAELNASQQKWQEAVDAFERVEARFPDSQKAGHTAKRHADILLAQGKHEAARDQYLKVLEVKAWRGPLWAESLFQVGVSLKKEGSLREAFAYFQRVYVLYEGYPEWAARAYLQSGWCLEQLNRRKEAINTYEELLASELLREQPQVAEAAQRLARLR